MPAKIPLLLSGTVLLAWGLSLALAGCDEKPAPATGKADSAPPAASSAPAPEPPATLILTVDDKAVTANSTRIPFEGADPRARIAAALAGNPRITGQRVTLAVMRPAKATRVAQAIAALKDAKASSILVKAQKRDGATGEIAVGWDPSPPCAAVAVIGKDVSISVWTVAGTPGQRFAKGLAGPDLTLGSEGFRKAINACDSPIAHVAGDESVPFGLLFDLALTTKDEAAENKINRALKFGVLLDAPAPGKKVTPL